MSSSDVPPRAVLSLTTLRVRMTAAFFAAASSVAAVAFLALYAWFWRSAVAKIDRDAEFYVHERAAEYLVGGDYRGPKRAVSVSALPPAVVAAFRARHPDARVAEVFSDDNRAFWFCAALPGGEAVVAECREDAESLRTNVLRPADRVGAIAAAFSEEHHGEGYGDVFHLLLAPGGEKIAARSSMPEAVLRRMVETGRERSDIHGLAHLRFDGELWAADTEPFFDGSVYVLFHRVDRTATRALLVTGAATLALLLAAGTFVAWLIAGSVSRGLDRVVSASNRAADGDYSARIERRPGEGAEIGRLVAAVNRMLDRTRRALEESRELADDIAHDLKTPLTRLLGRAELAFMERKQGVPAGEIAEDCRAMLSLVNTLLDLSRAENGARPGPGEVSDLADVAKRTASLFSSLADDRGIELSCRVPNDPVAVRAAAARVERVAANLVDNALKFTGEGGRVSVCVSRRRKTAVLKVSDTGCGISEADLPHVFDRFWRSDASRAIPGNGLGLALVRAIAGNCGGSASVSSTPGRGSVFSVVLPLSAGGR